MPRNWKGAARHSKFLSVTYQSGAIRISVFYQIPMIHWRRRLTTVIPAQQQAPMNIGLPPVFTSFTISVFSPIAAIVSTMKNLLSVFTYIYLSINYICLFDYLFISSQMSAKPYFIGSTGILLLW